MAFAKIKLALVEKLNTLGMFFKNYFRLDLGP